MKLKYIIFILLTAIIAGGFLYLKLRKTSDFEPLIKLKLASMVSSASGGLYKLDVGHIVIDITKGSVNATDIIFKPDSVRMIELEKQGLLGNTVFTVSLAKLNLEGLTAADLLNNKNISLDKIVVDSPEVKIIYQKRSVNKKNPGNLFEQVKSLNQSFSVSSLLLKNIRLTIINEGKGRHVSSFKNLSAFFTDIKIDSSTIQDSTRFLFARDAIILLKGYSAKSASDKYNFTIDSIALRPQDGSIKVFDLKLKPIGTRDEFSAKLDKMDDKYDIAVNSASVKNINWFGLISEDGLFCDEMQLNGGHINVYNDRRLPPPESREGNFPHQMLMKVKLPIYAGKVQLNDFKIVYEEFNPKANKTGTVEFNNVNGKIENVTNMPEHIAKNAALKINASASLMNAGQLNVQFLFQLTHITGGNFETDVELSTMDGRKMNATTEGLGLIKINELNINRLEAHLEGSNTRASGRIKFAYQNLSVDILKADDEGNTKKRALITFIAKNFLLKKSNPEKIGDPVKEYTVTYNRDKQKSFFNLIWKTILEGVKKSVRGK